MDTMATLATVAIGNTMNESTTRDVVPAQVRNESGRHEPRGARAHVWHAPDPAATTVP